MLMTLKRVLDTSVAEKVLSILEVFWFDTQTHFREISVVSILRAQ